MSVQRSFEEANKLHALGRLHDAAKLYARALKLDRRHFGSTYGLGLVQLQLGKFQDAQRLLTKAVELDGTSADAEHHLAISLTGSGDIEQALPHYEKALALDPHSAQTHNNLGYALQNLDWNEKAVAHFERALAIQPRYVEAANNLANSLRKLGRLEEAVHQYQRAIAARPDYMEARSNLASTLAEMKRHEEAIAQCEQALAIRPQFPPALVSLGEALAAAGRFDEALATYRSALAIDPSSIEIYIRLGHIHFLLGEADEAMAQYEKLQTIKPDHANSYTDLGVTLLALGRSDEGLQELDTAVALDRSTITPYFHILNSRPVRDFKDLYFAELHHIASEAKPLSDEDQIKLHFALGKGYADLGDFEVSFQHLQRGSLLHRRKYPYEEKRMMEEIARIKAAFSTELLRASFGSGDRSSKPIFIVGMPRSGMALLEQVLASIPGVFGAGRPNELRKLATGTKSAQGLAFPESFVLMPQERRIALGDTYMQAIGRRAPDARHIVDRSADNFLFAGMIPLILPEARIIHLRRDARDLALSCFSTLFTGQHEYSYDLAELGRYIRAYERLMDHWREVLPPGMMIEVDYEELVRNFNRETRRVVSHCRVEWNDACLDPHKTERLVFSETPLQVRCPIYTSSIGRWQRYGDRLQPLLQALATA